MLLNIICVDNYVRKCLLKAFKSTSQYHLLKKLFLNLFDPNRFALYFDIFTKGQIKDRSPAPGQHQVTSGSELGQDQRWEETLASGGNYSSLTCGPIYWRGEELKMVSSVGTLSQDRVFRSRGHQCQHMMITWDWELGFLSLCPRVSDWGLGLETPGWVTSWPQINSV